ncbi:hypothetical protein LJC71_04780 [Desulfosarcina sp. OttesenSCG-928-A07]|nr:hypothetical protein [Desulfosarcina sp. OttesenSCG-928-G17]MDL2329052.1 hypothetical protein [Desulfosarcina sp. OttesenSCG-928-A07]
METLAIIFSLLLFLCLILALVSIFTPKVAPFKEKARGKGFLFWLGAGIVCSFVVAATAPELPQEQEGESATATEATSQNLVTDDGMEARIAAAGRAIAIDPDEKEDEADTAKQRAEYEQNTEWLRGEVSSLLAELDGFRNTQIFRECIYGCGADNPANEWNLRRKALQEQMTPQFNAAIELKAAPGELWQLGMAYGRGNDADIKWFRNSIEEALTQ